MIATDGIPTISSPVQTRRPVGGHRQAGSNVSVTRDLDTFYARYGGPCKVCRVARDYHWPLADHEFAPEGHTHVWRNGACISNDHDAL